ncbi:MAG: NifU N-terminal domain-containing protein [Phycisphaeraceae bacterium]|nr:MAG: NifU N-terminal domain-containing protein [Phycisphaeraceae bacterium]
MPYHVLRFQDTPNPNALKCVLDRAIAPTARSYRSADDAGGDPTALALFAIPGVANLLILNDWITVGKRSDARWADLKPAISDALRDAP